MKDAHRSAGGRMKDMAIQSQGLSESDRLGIACRVAGVGIWQWDLVTGRMDYSDAARAICGFPAIGEITFRMVYDITHPDDVDWMKTKTEEALDHACPEPTVYRYRDTSLISAMKPSSSLMFRGEEESVALDTLVGAVIAPYQHGPHGPLEVSGPPIRIAGRCATPLAMAIHELATNAVKHGALSAPSGRIALSWTRDEAGGPLDIAWEETGGPEVRAPADAGFGMKLLSGQLFHAPDRLEILFRPAGLICRIRLADGAHV